MTSCAKPAPVIDSLAGEAKCLPTKGYEKRWTHDERLWCADLNDDIDKARAKAANKSPSPFSGGTY